MDVKYLQHQQFGTVQLLTMQPGGGTASCNAGDSISSALASKNSKSFESKDDAYGEHEPVPLPIQMFLWRQTNHFLGAKVGKLYEASCVTFERIVVQNILYGLSPSLSSAFTTISRWRFIRASFPHIIQCCASLLKERLKEDESLPISGSLAKMLYILHWLLLDASAECNENVASSGDGGIDGAPVLCLRQLTYPIFSIQTFVYLLTPLMHTIKEEEIEDHIRLQTGLRIWQALWQHRLPDILCFCAPVKQRKAPSPLLAAIWPGGNKVTFTATAEDAGIYLGDEPPARSSLTRRATRSSRNSAAKIEASIASPPPKPPRTDVRVLKEIHENCQQQQLTSSVDVTVVPTSQTSVDSSQPGCSVVRSVSDYRASALADDHRRQHVDSRIRRSRTDVFDSQSPDIEEDESILISRMDALRFKEDSGGSYSEIFHMGDRAPLASLHEICSDMSTDNGSRISVDSQQCQRNSAAGTEPQGSQRGNVSQSTEFTKISSVEETSSVVSQQTIINRQGLAQNKAVRAAADDSDQTPTHPIRKSSTIIEPDTTTPGSSQQCKAPSITHSDKIEMADPREATYLDVAAIRCLLIRSWSEEGVHWAVKYLHNRMTDIRSYQQALQETILRSRSNSIPLLQPLKNVRRENSSKCSTWTDLRDKMDVLNARLNSITSATSPRGDETSNDATVTKEYKNRLSAVAAADASLRRVSVNTLPPNQHALSRGGQQMSRSQSEPPPLSRAAPSADGGLSSMPSPSNNDLFPEAIGCARFIERNGHLSGSALLKTLVSLTDAGTTVRVLELVLNISDHLLAIAPTTAPANPTLYFEGVASIAFRVYLHLGCPNGCNEGIRTAQADFLRVKLRAILAQMHKIGPERLAEILRAHVRNTAYHQLIDCLHAMIVFCQDAGARPPDQRCPSTVSERGGESSYCNNFKDSHSGIESMLLKTLLTPLISKFKAEIHNFSLPENMSICQDIRLFVAYVQRHYNNPLRIAALSALRCEFSTAEPVGNRLGSSRHSATRSSYTTDGNRLVPESSGSIGSCSRDNVSLRRGLFKRKEKTENLLTTGITGGTVAVTEEHDSDSGGNGATASDGALGRSSPSTSRNVASSVDEMLSSIGNPLLAQQTTAKKKSVQPAGGSKLQFAFNLLKSVRNDNSEEENWDDTTNANNLDDDSISGNGGAAGDESGNGGDTLAPGSSGIVARTSFRSISNRPSGYRQRVSLTASEGKDDAVSPTQQTESILAPVIPIVTTVASSAPLLPYLPPRKLLTLKDIREGAKRFAFLLELSNPGEFPDVPLIAALPELRSPVLSRASLLLECVHFVYRCNHGDWPEWMRFSASAYPSSSLRLRGRNTAATNTISSVAFTNTTSSAGTATFAIGRGGSRRSFFLQRAAGRAFYAWAVQLAVGLQNRLDHQSSADVRNDERSKCGKIERRNAKLMDDLEDFLDDGTVNDAIGEHCPPALQLMVCMLLAQITAFMRETFQALSRSRVSQKSANPQSLEKSMSHRRWSILSNTFNQQTGFIYNINDLHLTTMPHERRVSYSTADEESSPRGSYDLIEDPSLNVSASSGEKKVSRLTGRRLLKHSIVPQLPTQHTQAHFQPQPLLTGSLGGRRRDSLKLRKISRLQGGGTENSATLEEPAKSAASTSAALPFDQRRQKTISLRNRAKRFHMRSMRIKDTVTAAAQGAQRSPRSSVVSTVTANSSPAESPALSERARQYAAVLAAERATTARKNVLITRTASAVAARLRPGAEGAMSGGASRGQRQSPIGSAALSDFQNSYSPEKRQSATIAGASPLTASVEDEEEEMMRNMPWINTMITLANRFDFSCTHEPTCRQWCFERVHRQCQRLSEALKLVYDVGSSGSSGGASIASEKRFDRRRQYISAWRNHVETSKQKRTSDPRRKSATIRRSGVDHMRGLLIENLSEIEDLRSVERRDASEDANINSAELLTRTTNMQHFIRTQVHNIVHAPLSGALKGVIAMNHEQYRAMLKVSWNLLIHADVHVVSTAAAAFISCAVKCGKECVSVMREHLASADPNVRSQAICRFFALWKNRYHVWLKMEDNAQMIFKVPPPVIDFTSPSPPIGQSQLPVVDPPWMPYMKTKVEELTLKEEEHSTSQTIMTMTRTRRKQKQELVKRAVREAEERQSELRRQYLLRCTPLIQLAAYEPALFYQHHFVVQQQQQQAQSQQGQQQQEQQFLDENDYLAFQQNLTSNDFGQPPPQPTGSGGGGASTAQTSAGGTGAQPPPLRQQSVLPVAQPLLPSSILSAVPLIIEMFDDTQIDNNGCSVGDVCRKVSWNCIIEDCSLFLRNFLEKLTDFSKQEYLMSLLRKLILVMRPLPSQMAYTLLNYLFGFIIYYVRSPCDGSDRAISLALSLTWLIAPYVHSLYFKDLKQTLKKEQCDQAIMITANVPAAKKVIVHGPDSISGGIPSQFPIQEDTQFQQILTDSLEFFNIPTEDIEHYFLIDSKTGTFHNPASYVRDFYFFHRSFYPQLTLLKVDPEVGLTKIRESAFQQKFIEVGKCLLTHSALKYSNIPQRIFFLHDEFTHLPSFPRKSLESCFGMYQGTMGTELQAMDSIHKFVWNTLISDMFEKMENAFMFGDLHLFVNLINGIMIIHCEDILILRRCMSTYITMTIHFSTLFASQGFFLIMPTILRCYSQRQTNRMFTQVVEFVCKQFYILHRKPFLLQMFGSVADICDQNANDLEIKAMQVKAKYLFGLLLAMENMNDLVDKIDILSLVSYPKPLKALDLCYKEDPNSFMILTDGIASCVTVCAFAPESKRSYQMLLIMQALMPCLLKHLEEESSRQGNSPAAIKHEVAAYTTMCVEMRMLVNSCESLSRGPTRSFDIGLSVGDRGKSFIADSPQFFDPPTIVEDETKPSYYSSSREKKNNDAGEFGNLLDNSEIQKEIFRGPRNSLLNLTTFFIVRASARLKELSKLASSNSEHAVRIPEIFDHRCHARLSEVAISLLKIAPYDLATLACSGLQKFFLHVLPVVDWSVESNRSVLNMILRRLDKTIAKVAKKPSIRRRANWQAIGTWLDGLYHTLTLYPYIAHLHPLKTITQISLRLIIGDQCSDDSTSSNQLINQTNSTILSATLPSPAFCQSVLKLTAFLMQALGQNAFSLEYVCGPETLNQLSECTEAVLCHILMPLFLRAAVPGKEATQFQPKDIAFLLNFMHTTICPPLAKQSLAPINNPVAFTRDISGRQGSVSITDRGYSATVSTLRVVRDSVAQSVLLALKIMIVTFQKQMTPHWVKVAKILKEIIAKKAGGPTLVSFLNFLVNVNLPISLIIQPLIQNKLNQRFTNEHDINWQNEIQEAVSSVGEKPLLEPITAPSPSNGWKISETTAPHSGMRGFFCLLNTLSRELQTMKEDFCSRVMEYPSVHTPVLGDVHSESGSSVSTSMPRAAGTETRRLSSSAALAKLRSATSSTAKAASTNITSLGSSTAVEVGDPTAISECTEDELSSSSRMATTSGDGLAAHRTSHALLCHGVGAQLIKYGSSTSSRQCVSTQPSGMTDAPPTGLVRGMFQSIRHYQPRSIFNDAEHSHFLPLHFQTGTAIEMPDLVSHHHRSKSLSKKRTHIVDDPIIAAAQTKTDVSHPPLHGSLISRPHTASDAAGPYSVGDNERPQVVLFSTPKKSVSSYGTTDSDEVYYITAKHHVI